MLLYSYTGGFRLHCAIPSKSGDFAGKKLIFNVSRQKSKKQAQLAYHCMQSEGSALNWKELHEFSSNRRVLKGYA